MNYCNLYGESQLKLIIESDFNNNTIGHAYLLCGQDEIYLKYLSKCVAKKLISGHDEGCECQTCLKISKNIHSDVLVLGESLPILVEDVKNIVEQSFVYPLEGSRKVFILNNFELCTVQAQNKLLKTLEEPNSYVTFIITTTQKNSVLPTIRSRAKQIEIPLLNNEQIENYILNNSSIKSSEVKIYSVSSEGNLTKANKIINDADFLKIKYLCVDILQNMQASFDVLKYSSKVLCYKDRLGEVFDELNLVVLDALKFKMGIKINNNNLQNVNYSIKALKLISNKILIANSKLNSNCNASAVVDNLLMGMLEVKHKWK